MFSNPYDRLMMSAGMCRRLVASISARPIVCAGAALPILSHPDPVHPAFEAHRTLCKFQALRSVLLRAR
jgi:hypothetical protein